MTPLLKRAYLLAGITLSIVAGAELVPSHDAASTPVVATSTAPDLAPLPTATPTPVRRKLCYLESTDTTFASSYTSVSRTLTIESMDDHGGWTCPDAGRAAQNEMQAIWNRLNGSNDVYNHTTGYDFMPGSAWHLEHGAAGQPGAFYTEK